MIGYAWLTLRQIRKSIKLGRLEEAAPLLQMPEIRTHRQAGELFGLLARRLRRTR
jgi:hypothetical protein